MNKKYKTEKDDSGLLRIVALRDGSWGSIGTKGGLVQTEDNLSQDGDCWLYDNSRMYDNSMMTGNSMMSNSAHLSGEAHETRIVKSINGSRHTITMVLSLCSLQIGCHLHPIDYWIENYEKIGTEESYTPEEIKEYGMYIKLCKEIMGM